MYFNEARLKSVLLQLGGGAVAHRLLAANGDHGVLRPFIENGKTWCTVRDPIDPTKYKVYATNAPTIMTREDWEQVDKTVRWEAKQRLVFWNALRTAVPRNIPNGWGKYVVTEFLGTGSADGGIAMDPIGITERSRPAIEPVGWPLPVIYSDNSWTARQMAVQADSGAPLGQTSLALAARKTAEITEMNALGLSDPFTYQGVTMYGALNFPYRLTYTMTSPESASPSTTVNQFLEIIKLLEDNHYYGPYAVFYSNGWGMYLNKDYSSSYPGVTTLSRLKQIPKLASWTGVDYMSDFSMLIMQLTPDVVQAAEFMALQAIQWEEQGGLELKFKVMTGRVPMFKRDSNSKTGYVHAAAGVPTTTTTTTTTT